MVEAKNKIYLVTGGLSRQRQRAIKKIKRNIFQQEDSLFTLTTLYSEDLDLNHFKELVFTLSFQNQKIILIKNFTSLSKPVKKYLSESLPKVLVSNYLIFESDTPHYCLKAKKRVARDDFFSFIFKNSIKYQGKKSLITSATIEDFRSKLYQNDLKGCLFFLEELLSSKSREKILATQILGLLTSKFSYLKDSKKKEKALAQLWRADRCLKETNIDVRLLIERLIVGLIS